jgi:predicted SAM-dependent methyltransferase
MGEVVYVQYGCGRSCPEGWINFDASPTLRLQRLTLIGKLFQSGEIVFPKRARFGDIVKGLPVADGSVRGVYASHVLEHLTYAEFWRALDHTFRMLKPGGIFRLIVPDLQVRAQRYLEKLQIGDTEANSWFMHSVGFGAECRQRGIMASLRNAFGHSNHLWMWDQNSIANALQKTGFIHIRRCRFGDCTDEAFRSVEEVSRFHDGAEGLEECAMEAIKPDRASLPGSAP